MDILTQWNEMLFFLRNFYESLPLWAWALGRAAMVGFWQARTPYTQYPIIRNGHIRNSAEFLEKFKKRALGRSNLRNASKNLRNGQCSDFQS